jgi:hypothetical protein
MTAKLVLDPNPCHLYPWSGPCDEAYSGAHACVLPGGHEGLCKCSCGDTSTFLFEAFLRGDREGLLDYATWADSQAHYARHLAEKIPLDPYE